MKPRSADRAAVIIGAASVGGTLTPPNTSTGNGPYLKQRKRWMLPAMAKCRARRPREAKSFAEHGHCDSVAGHFRRIRYNYLTLRCPSTQGPVISSFPHFPLLVFFDGACPLCSREIGHYRRQNRGGRLKPIDISAPDFDPQSYGIPLDSFMAELHAIDQAGTVYRGIAVFRAIWQAFPEKTVYRVMGRLIGLPLVEPLASAAYRLFARLRRHLPGRKPGSEQGSCRIDR